MAWSIFWQIFVLALLGLVVPLCSYLIGVYLSTGYAHI
jgi:hypothetical protein